MASRTNAATRSSRTARSPRRTGAIPLPPHQASDQSGEMPVVASTSTDVELAGGAPDVVAGEVIEDVDRDAETHRDLEDDVVEDEHQTDDEQDQPDADDDLEDEAPIHYEDRVDGIEYSLDEDPETSLVGSIYLHLLSEHSCYGALRLSDEEAIKLHEELHLADPGCEHSVLNWGFRPHRALVASMQNIDEEHAAHLQEQELTKAGT